MKKVLFFFGFLIPIVCGSQSLGSERIKRLNKSVVRITIDSTQHMGTGFFVHESGLVATCEHVIEKAYIRDSVTEEILTVRKIFIEFQNGEKIEVRIMDNLLSKRKDYKKAVIYDYSLLEVLSKPKTKYEILKIGSWSSDINEGEIVYSCGYPTGIKQRVISQGLFSTKFKQTKDWKVLNIVADTFKRNAAWLDLTMNKGNSGGPVIKLGDTPEEDRVIGIATFILNPFSEQTSKLEDYLINRRGISIISEGISSNQISALYAKAISQNSIGVSGCISIEYLNAALKKIK